jgi:hypothetical protein
MKSQQRNFRPWPENEKRLEQAAKLGFNISELINEVLKRSLDAALKEKTKSLQQVLAEN